MTEKLLKNLNLDDYQADLVAQLPELYPDEAERGLVEAVLIPQFRALVERVISEHGLLDISTLRPTQLNQLCHAIDTSIQQNADLLEITGLLKPAVSKIDNLRAEARSDILENRMRQFRNIFQEKGITTKQQLLLKGPKWFVKEDFSPYGKGKGFLGAVFDRVIGNVAVTLAMLSELADAIGLTSHDAAEIQVSYRDALAAADVHSREDLIEKGSKWFMRTDFPPYKKGIAFAAKVLGRTVSREFDLNVLEEFADAVGFPKIDTARYRLILKEKGVIDWRTLFVLKGQRWFCDEDFSPFGKGHAFLAAILGRNIPFVTVPLMEEAAGILCLPQISEETKKNCRNIFFSKGIRTREALVDAGPVWFMSQDFAPYGLFKAFCAFIFGEPRAGSINTTVLKNIAQVIGLPSKDDKVSAIPNTADLDVFNEDLLTVVPAIFPAISEQEVVTDVLLPQLRITIEQVIAQDQAEGDIQVVTPKRLNELYMKVLSELDSNELLDSKGFLKPAMPYITMLIGEMFEAKKNLLLLQYRFVLEDKQVTDRATLLNKGVNWFKDEDFGEYGKGYAFAGRILGRTVSNTGETQFAFATLHEIADALGYSPDEELNMVDVCKTRFAQLGIVDRETLFAKGGRWLFDQDFSPYGKANAFIGSVLGRSLGVVTATTPILVELADVLGFAVLSEEEKRQSYIDILAQKGVVDRKTLYAKGITWFITEDFPPYGKGKMLAVKILGRKLDGHITAKEFAEVAKALGYKEKNDEEKIEEYKAMLAERGVTDRLTLRYKGTKWFEKEKFDPYGFGLAFASLILKRTILLITVPIIEEIANALGYENPTEDDLLEKYKNVAREKGIVDKRTLIQGYGPKWFRSQEFAPFGMAVKFVIAVLDRKVYDLTTDILLELAAVLDLPDLCEATKQRCRAEFVQKGIRNRSSLTAAGSNWFEKQDFGEFGNGRRFARFILGRTHLDPVSPEDLETIATLISL